MKKRVAICFYGQIRFYEIFNLFYKHVIDSITDISFDFFLGTWDDYDKSKIQFDFTNTSFVDPSITSKWKTGNTQKMAYLVNEVTLLKKKHEIDNNFSYNAVVLIRPDVVFELSKFREVLFKVFLNQVDKPYVSVIDDIKLDEEKKFKLHEDWMFIFTSEALDIHSSFYNYFYLQKKYFHSNARYREGGHWIHIFYFKHNNFIIEKNYISTVLVRPTRDLETFKKFYKEKDFTILLVDTMNNDYSIKDNFKDRILK